MSAVSRLPYTLTVGKYGRVENGELVIYSARNGEGNVVSLTKEEARSLAGRVKLITGGDSRSIEIAIASLSDIATAVEFRTAEESGRNRPEVLAAVDARLAELAQLSAAAGDLVADEDEEDRDYNEEDNNET